MDKNSLQIGVNLGGWLSQYPIYDQSHFDAFITAEDIKRIADWGLDHVRLPVDYPVLEDDDRPGVYKPGGLEAIESCLAWCQANGLRLVLDLHKAPGYRFDAPAESSLFGDPKLQDRFARLWEAITLQFADRMNGDLAFELLNEIVLPDSHPWNALVKQVVARIRSLDAQRLIIVGGNHYNAASELQNLDIIEDPNILYTFHFYHPMVISHQLAPWVPALAAYGQAVDYPGQASRLEEFLQTHPEYQPDLGSESGIDFDSEYLRSMLKPAVDFSARIGQTLYCGEFGVYERAATRTRQAWTRDLVSLLSEFGMGGAYWSYKAMDFGLVGKDGRIVDQELIEIISKR